MFEWYCKTPNSWFFKDCPSIWRDKIYFSCVVLTSILFHSLKVYRCQVLPTRPVTHFRIYFARFAFAFRCSEGYSYSYWADFLFFSQQSPLDPSLYQCNPTRNVSTQLWSILCLSPLYHVTTTLWWFTRGSQ